MWYITFSRPKTIGVYNERKFALDDLQDMLDFAWSTIDSYKASGWTITREVGRVAGWWKCENPYSGDVLLIQFARLDD